MRTQGNRIPGNQAGWNYRGTRPGRSGSHSKTFQVISCVVPNDSIPQGFESCRVGTGHRYGNASCTRQGGVLSSLWSPGRRFSFRSAIIAVWWKRLWWAGVAQLVEHLICNQRVGGSNPFASSICLVSSRTAEARRDKIPVRSSSKSVLPKGLPDRLNAQVLLRAAKLRFSEVSAMGSNARQGL